MRLLIYAMESSGASTFCYFLGQRPGSVAIIDVWSRNVTPPIETAHPVVAKATVTMILTIADHTVSFAPDRRILFIRDPVAVWASLSGYPYAHGFGRIEDKIRRFERVFNEAGWDAVLRYEDFVARDPEVIRTVDALGWPCHESYYRMERSLEEIQQFNTAASRWLEQHVGDGWGFGNIRPGLVNRAFAMRPDRPDLEDEVARLSPALHRHYAAYWQTADSSPKTG